MAIRENIIKLRKLYDITQEELASIAGVTRGAVSQWEGGFSEPRMGAIQKMADHFRISKSNIIEDNGMEMIDPVTKKQRPHLPPNAIIPPPSRPAYMPLLGRVHAGDAQEPDIICEKISVPYEIWNRHKDAYLLEVEGNCMSRIYPEGCYVAIDGKVEPQNGSVAVVSIDGADYVMRKLYRGANTLILSPDSWENGYEDIVIKEGDEHTVEFVGTVVWFQPSKEME